MFKYDLLHSNFWHDFGVNGKDTMSDTIKTQENVKTWRKYNFDYTYSKNYTGTKG